MTKLLCNRSAALLAVAVLAFVPAPLLHAAVLCDPCVWVANQLSTSLSVVDAASNTVVLNIPAGQTPQWLTASPSGTRVYVSTHGEGNDGLVTVIDTSSYRILANIRVGKNPTGLALNPTGSRLYVLNSGNDTMSVINTGTNSVISRPVHVAAGPSDIVVSPDGKRIYISATNAGAIQVLDSGTGQQVGALIPVGKAPAGLALDPKRALLYVADFLGNEVGIVDTATNHLIRTVQAGSGAIAVARNPLGKQLYVADAGAGTGTTVSVIDTTSNLVAATIPVDTSPHALAVNSNGSMLYVTNQKTSDLSAIDPGSNTVLATVPVDASPLGLAVVYAGLTTPPSSLAHIASAVNGEPRFNPGSTTFVTSGDRIQFTVRVPNAATGTPAGSQILFKPQPAVLERLGSFPGRPNLPISDRAIAKRGSGRGPGPELRTRRRQQTADHHCKDRQLSDATR